MKSLFLILFSASYVFSVEAQTVIRGPYLQSPTENSIVVKWRTDEATNSKVQYGTNPSNLDLVATSNSTNTNHTLTLTNLTPSTTYYYAVGNSTQLLTTPSDTFRFKTNPIPGVAVPTRVWAIGDFGKGNAEQVAVKNSYLNYSDSIPTDVWIWLGDNVYDDGKDEEYQQKLFQLDGFSDIFNFTPFWPSPGNHDYNEVWQQSAFFGIPYSNIDFEDHQGPYFDMVHVPTQAEAGGYPSQYELFYSFDYGDVHFLSLNSEVYDFTQTFSGINQMKQWIEQDLIQNDKTFTIAYFHQPPYSKGSHDSDDPQELVMKAMRERVIPLLEDYDIDLVVCGHSHVFERSKMIHGHYGNSFSFNPVTMLKDSTNGNYAQGNAYRKDGLNNTPDGTVYVVCGNSGSKEDAPSLNYPIMEYVDGGNEACGSFIMDIYKNRLDAKYLHMDGTVKDEFTILKSNLNVHVPAIFICEGENVTINPIISGGSDSLYYQWTLNNQVSATITVGAQNYGSHLLTVSDSVTGQTETSSFTVAPGSSLQIQQANDTLYASEATNYQWYLNGDIIIGANQAFYIPTVSGQYSVSTYFGTCESNQLSVNLNLNVLDNKLQGVTIYPNPTNDELFLVVAESHLNKSFQIYSINGTLVKSGTIDGLKTQISVSNLIKGSYNLRISGINQAVKFVKK
ncbi:MAG: T9SS type A sorting domain-containing protein [Flavobacteriales bacterium]|nr:T9SS type A sorting domain-containing protein [Flavobacteriales bacterium]